MLMVRAAALADAVAIARVQVLTWRVAYAGLIDADYLAGLSVAQRTDQWQRMLTPGRLTTMVALGDDDEVIGFASYGPSRDDGAPATEGEVVALYVLQSHWGRGVGRRLCDDTHAALHALGHTASIVWVLDGNERAIRFYRSAGYELDGATKDLTLAEGVVLHHVRMRTPLER